MPSLTRVSTLLIAAAATLATAGLEATAQDTRKLRGNIRIDGSSTVYPITEAVAESFKKVAPNVKVTVGVSGTGGGFKRFAAKEACSKALGTGFRRGVFWRDMGVVHMRSGAPTMALTNGALDRLKESTPEGYRAVIHVTLTDDHPYAQAFVIIEAVPE